MSDHAAIQSVIDALGLTVTSEFVPFSQSRNKDEKHKTLNWRVTLLKDGKAVLTTDYSAGVAHCPAHKASVKEMGEANSLMRASAIAYECENGFAAKAFDNANAPSGHHVKQSEPKTPLTPDALDVIWSLATDADVLESGSFEEWAGNLGFDPDSRKAEKIYQDCLATALKLHRAIGDNGLAQLREAFLDY